MKSGQLMEHNMRSPFLKNNTQNMTEKLVPDPALKNQILEYIWINILKFIFIVCQV